MAALNATISDVPAGSNMAAYRSYSLAAASPFRIKGYPGNYTRAHVAHPVRQAQRIITGTRQVGTIGGATISANIAGQLAGIPHDRGYLYVGGATGSSRTSTPGYLTPWADYDWFGYTRHSPLAVVCTMEDTSAGDYTYDRLAEGTVLSVNGAEFPAYCASGEAIQFPMGIPIPRSDMASRTVVFPHTGSGARVDSTGATWMPVAFASFGGGTYRNMDYGCAILYLCTDGRLCTTLRPATDPSSGYPTYPALTDLAAFADIEVGFEDYGVTPFTITNVIETITAYKWATRGNSAYVIPHTNPIVDTGTITGDIVAQTNLGDMDSLADTFVRTPAFPASWGADIFGFSVTYHGDNSAGAGAFKIAFPTIEQMMQSFSIRHVAAGAGDYYCPGFGCIVGSL